MADRRLVRDLQAWPIATLEYSDERTIQLLLLVCPRAQPLLGAPFAHACTVALRPLLVIVRVPVPPSPLSVASAVARASTSSRCRPGPEVGQRERGRVRVPAHQHAMQARRGVAGAAGVLPDTQRGRRDFRPERNLVRAVAEEVVEPHEHRILAAQEAVDHADRRRRTVARKRRQAADAAVNRAGVAVHALLERHLPRRVAGRLEPQRRAQRVAVELRRARDRRGHAVALHRRVEGHRHHVLVVRQQAHQPLGQVGREPLDDGELRADLTVAP